jgi:hypothetical protein
MVERRVLEVRRVETVGLPFDAMAKTRTIRALGRVMTDRGPATFGYQFIVEATARI